MRPTSRTTMLIIVVVTILFVAVAFAAITNITLDVKGTAKAEGSQSNFVVQFIGTPTTTEEGTTTATIDAKDKTKGEMNVIGLSAKGDTAIATYTVKNMSEDLSADLTAEATSSNEDYFEVICRLEKTTLKAQEETTLTATVKLLKTIIDENKENSAATIGINVKADPKQQGEEANGGSTTVTSRKLTNPYLPTGFSYIEGTDLSNGLTIQDSTGNQYVWVEVPKAEEVYQTAGADITTFTDDEYAKIETDLQTYTNDYRNQTSFIDEYNSDETTGLTSIEYTQLKQKMLKSVYQNGGFYVGKYETGIENTPRTSGNELIAPTETPVIKPNAYPYNYVTCRQSQTLANNMESGEYTTSLMFGVQWDLVLKYLESKGISQADLKTNSTDLGNYNNNLWSITNDNSKYSEDGSSWTEGAYGTKDSDKDIFLSTGAKETFAKQGIYDFAGNAMEWTLEYTSDSTFPCTYRGGAYNSNGNYGPSNYRGSYATVNSYYGHIGFRVTLY